VGIGRANKTLQAAEPQRSILDTLVVVGGDSGWVVVWKKSYRTSQAPEIKIKTAPGIPRIEKEIGRKERSDEKQ
jgi:hypothetical protein